MGRLRSLHVSSPTWCSLYLICTLVWGIDNEYRLCSCPTILPGYGWETYTVSKSWKGGLERRTPVIGHLGHPKSSSFLSILKRKGLSLTDPHTVNAPFYHSDVSFFFLIFIYYLFIMFIFVCVGSSFLCEGFLQLWWVGATLHRGARACHYRGLSCCGAQAPDAQAQ